MKIRFLPAFVVSAILLLVLSLVALGPPGIVLGVILLAIAVHFHWAESRLRALIDLELLTVVPLFFGIAVLAVLQHPIALLLSPLLLAVSVYGFSVMSEGRTTRNVVLATIGALLLDALLLPAFSCGARESDRHAQCVNQMKLIGLAIHNYRAEHGTLPPLRECDSAGNPRHSWRVRLLPDLAYLDSSNSSREPYRFDEPWNGPDNAQLASKRPSAYGCPSNREDGRAETTNYVAVMGSDGGWLGGPPREGEPNPVWVVESRDAAVKWLEPRDISLEAACQGTSTRDAPGLSSAHPSGGGFLTHAPPPGVNALFADGSVRFVPPSVPREVLRAAFLGDREKQETLGEYTDAPQPVNWPRCASLLGMVVCFALMLAWPRKSPEGEQGKTAP